MNSTTESRVVQIKFDNSEFEKNVQKSLDTLNKLNDALEFKDGTKGLDNLTDASRNVNMSSLSDSVSNVEKHFSSLEIIGITALSNITNSAVNAGKQLLSSFIQPLTTGGWQRSLNMAQAKFMFNGLLKDSEKEMIGAVGEAGTIMDNIYQAVDGTIYSLDKAALVAARLLASGINGIGENSEMTQILKGVAGVSSVFSADYERVGDLFSTIKAQTKLMGNQVQSFNAMGVPVYATLADYLNSVSDSANYTEESIKEMVSKGKIDFDTFSKAMTWAFGDQAAKSKELFTGAIEDMKAAASRIGQTLADPIGLAARDFFNATVPLLDSIKSRLSFSDEEGNMIGPLDRVGQAFTKFVNAIITGIDLLSAAINYDETVSQLKRLEENGLADKSRLKNLEKYAYTIKKIGEVLTALGNIISFISGILSFVWNVAGNIIKFFAELGLSILSVLGKATSGLAVLKKLGKTWAKDIFSFIKAMTKIISNSELLVSLTTMISDFFTNISKNAKKAGKTIETLAKTIGNTVYILATKLAKTIKAVVKELKGFLDLTSVINTFLMSKFTLGLAQMKTAFGAIQSQGGITKSFGALLKNFGGKTLNNIRAGSALFADGMDQVRTSLIATQKSLKANIILKIALAVGALAVSLKIVSGIDPKRLTAGIAAIGVLMFMLNKTLGGSLKMIKALSGFSAKQMVAFGLLQGYFISLSLALIGLAAAVKILGSLNLEQALIGVISLGAISFILISVLKQMSKIPRGGKSVLSLIVIAASLDMLAIAFYKLGSLSWKGLARATVAMAVIGGMITVLQLLMSKISKTEGSASTMKLIVIAAAISILANTFTKLALLEWNQIKNGVIAMGVVMAALLGTFLVMGKVKLNNNVFASALGLTRVASTLQTTFQVFQQLGTMSINAIKRATIGLAAIEAVVVSTYMLLNLVKQDDKTKSLLMMVQLNAIANSLKTLAKSFVGLGTNLNPKQLKTAAISMGILEGVVLSMLAVMSLISKIGGAKNMLLLSVSTLALAVALKLLSAVIISLGKVDIKYIAIGIGALGVVLLVLNGIAKIVSKNFLNMLKMSAGLAAFGLSLAALGFGIGILVYGLTSLKNLSAESILAFAGLIVILALLAPVVKTVGLSFLFFGAGVATVGIGLILVGAGLTAIGFGLKVIGNGFENLVESINSFANINWSAVLQLAGLIAIFGALAPLAILLAAALVVVGAGLGAIALAANGIFKAIQGIAKIVNGFLSELAKKIKESTKSALNTVKLVVPSLTKIVLEIKKLVKDIKKELDLVSDLYDDAFRAGKHVVEGLAKGINASKSSAIRAINVLAKDTLQAYKDAMGIESPSKEMAKMGMYTVQGYAKGVDDNINIAKESMEDFANAVLSSSDYASSISDINPTITPVVDLSNVNAAAKSINASLSAQQAMGISASIANTPSRMDVATSQILAGMKDAFVNASAIQNGGEMQSVTIEVPLNINGREFARATASDIQDQINIQQTRSDRMVGVR